MKRGAQGLGDPDLMAQIAKLQTTNNDYKLRISELEKDISTLMSSKSIDQQEIVKYLDKQHFIDELQSELRDAQHELSELRAMFAAQNSALLSTEDDSAEVIEQKSKVAVDITMKFAEQQKGLAEYKARNSELEKQLAVSNAENAQLVVENCELKNRIRDLTGNESIQGAEKSRLQGTVDDIYQQLQVQIKVNEESTKMIESLKSDIATTKSEYERLQVEFEKVSLANGSLTEKLAALESDARQSKAEVERLKKEKVVFEKEAQENKTEIAEQKRVIEKGKGQITKYKEQISVLKGETDDNALQKMNYESKLLELTSTLERTQAELEEQKRINHDIREEKTEVEAELNDLKAANDQLSFTIEEKRQEHTDAEKKSQDIKKKLSTMKLELEAARRDAQRSAILEAEVRNKQQALDNMKQQNQTLTFQLQELRNQSISHKSQVEQSQYEKDRVQLTIKRLQASQAKSTDIAKHAIKKMRNKCINKYKQMQVLYISRLNLLSAKIESLSQAVAGLPGVVTHNEALTAGFSEERLRFLSQIENHLRIIDKISHASATALQLPETKVPYATDLINKPSTLQEFLHLIRSSRRERKTGCHHSIAEVTSFMRKANL